MVNMKRTSIQGLRYVGSIHPVHEISLDNPCQHILQPTRLLLPFLLYCTAMGAVAVPKVNIILAVMCAQYGDESDAIIASRRLTNDQICNSASIHARMGRFMMWANIISGVGCAFSSPRLGSLSDRYGRKPLLAFSALGLVRNFLMAPYLRLLLTVQNNIGSYSVMSFPSLRAGSLAACLSIGSYWSSELAD